jgi:hypothetical protein
MFRDGLIFRVESVFSPISFFYPDESEGILYKFLLSDGRSATIECLAYNDIGEDLQMKVLHINDIV